MNGVETIKLGNLDAKRDLTFVKDTVEGFIEISKQAKFNGESTNIGMNEEVSIKELVEKISEITKIKIKIEIDPERVRPGKSEVDRLMCNNTKIKKHTNWKPTYNIEKGLTETINWMKDNKSFFKHKIYNK